MTLSGREREKSVVEVELVFLRDRVPVFFPFLEDRVEQRAHDLAELLNLRAKASEFLHHFLIGSRHSRPLNAAITAYVLIPCLRFLMLIIGTEPSAILAISV